VIEKELAEIKREIQHAQSAGKKRKEVIARIRKLKEAD
jgi:hypothetical protein